MANAIYICDSNNWTVVDQLVRRHFLPISYALIFIVGLVGNVTSLCVYVSCLRPWKSSSIIMVNLALTDLLYVLSLPFLVHYYSNGDSWWLGDFMCRFVRFVFHFNLYGSILFLTCHAVFRYVVVMRPLSVAQVQQKRWGVMACVCVWAITAAEVMPMLTMRPLKECDNKTYCLDFASTLRKEHVDWCWYSWILTTLGFLLPLVVVTMCYMGIVRKLSKGPDTSMLCRRRARHVTVLILVVFVVCFLPYHILRALRIKRGMPCVLERTIHTAYIVSRPLAGLNTFFNLALYTLSGDKFREAILRIFYRQSWISKVSTLLHVTISSNAGKDTPVAKPQLSGT